MRLQMILVLLGLAWGGHADADELRLDARRLFDEGTPKSLQWNDELRVIELRRGVLVEDDGPAAGYSYQRNEERLKEPLTIRKHLLIVDPRTTAATLLVGGSGDFRLALNGVPRPLDAPTKVGNYWLAYPLDPSWLREGSNDFTWTGQGMIWIARDDEYPAGSRQRTRHPNRSAKSRDGGATWNDRQLGTFDDVDGEYYVRLFLEQFVSRGELISPVLDLLNLDQRPIAAPGTKVGPVEIVVAGEHDAHRQMQIQYRIGSVPLMNAASWSFWHDLPSDGILPDVAERYLQLRVTLATHDPRQTPQLRAIVVRTARSNPPNMTESWRVVEARNPPLVRSAIPFEYEPFDHPSLRKLRELYRLDEVVRGARSELDMIARLALWASQRFRHGGHLKTDYPPWNALEILRSHNDGTPVGGFCQQFNVVFLQACESFGIAGRAVSIGPGNQTFAARGGHEVVELWSSEHRKWIYVDGQMAWYAVDRTTQTPLSLLELHDRQLDALANKPFPPVEIVTLAPQDRVWKSLTDWPPFVELRMIPRSNFLAVRAPLPLNQGMRGWSWTGHAVWHEPRSPAPLIYGERVTRRNDWEWSVDSVQLWLSASDVPDRCSVATETVAPSLKTIERQIDDGDWQACEAIFDWPLHAGRNRLAVRTRNTLDRVGPAAMLMIERLP